VVVAINRFPSDTEEELEAIHEECKRLGVESAVTEAFSKGGSGSIELAKKVVAAIQRNPTPDVRPMYDEQDALEDKIFKVATKVYGAASININDEARAKLARYAQWGFGHLPICIAKTQYSLTDDPKCMGAPSGWTLHISDASLSAGAGFVVAVAGNMMLMPGLPREPRALAIDVDHDGNIVGV
jgi:formate--tetrahydrofolate ligase